MKQILFIGTAALILSAPAIALANPADMFGMGADARGLGNAMTGRPSGAMAAYYNPAFLGFLGGAELSAGWLGADMSLKLSGDDYDSQQTGGVELGAATPLGGKLRWFSLGLAAYLPLGAAARLYTQAPDTPQFVLYRALNRFAVYPALAVKIGDYFALGLGCHILASASGWINFQIDLANQSAPGRDFLFDMKPAFAPTAGLAFAYRDIISGGISYRGEIDMPISFPANFDLGIISLLVQGQGLQWYTPHELSVGASWRPIPPLSVQFDATWALWSGAPDQSTQVTIQPSVLLPEVKNPPVEPGFSDIIIPRLGIEYRPLPDLPLRVGYLYYPTPVPSQVYQTNLIDADRHIITMGAGYRFKDPLEVIPQGISVDGFFQYHLIASRSVVKKSVVDDVGDYGISGRLIVGGLALTLHL